jgi:hydroxymethylbilane synthase
VSALRLGTRGSALALVQARLVAAALGDGAEVVPVVTTGDRHRADPDKEKWVKELELALLGGEVDLAVHSAKDVPSALPDGLELVGALARADARDALCGAPGLAALAGGARVGTSSLRRASQLLALRADLRIVDVRGNVDTRLRALDGGEADALVLAAAGLTRLGRVDAVGTLLDELVPAPGQGVIVLEARAGDARALREALRVTDAATWTALTCERALVAGLDASCHTPLGAHAVLGADGSLTLESFVGLPDGSAWVRDRVEGRAEDAGALGALAARRVVAAGGGELLRRAEALAA